VTNHTDSHAGSQIICDTLLRLIQEQLPNIERKETKDTCAIFQQAGSQFAHLYHYKKSPNAKIYFRADPDIEPHRFPSDIELQKRPKIDSSWEKRFPYFFIVSPSDNLEEIAKFIVEEVYPFTLISSVPVFSEIQTELLVQRQQVESEGYFNVSDSEDARHRVNISIVQRQGQADFRSKLLKAYAYRCSVTSCDAEPALEAAHIIPYRGAKTNHIANGLLLRADIHTLFDLHLLSIQPETLEVVLTPALMKTAYIEFASRKLFLPRDKAARPSQVALTSRYKHFLQKCDRSLLWDALS
jgi:putative restriction endonuclease